MKRRKFNSTILSRGTSSSTTLAVPSLFHFHDGFSHSHTLNDLYSSPQFIHRRIDQRTQRAITHTYLDFQLRWYCRHATAFPLSFGNERDRSRENPTSPLSHNRGEFYFTALPLSSLRSNLQLTLLHHSASIFIVINTHLFHDRKKFRIFQKIINLIIISHQFSKYFQSIT